MNNMERIHSVIFNTYNLSLNVLFFIYTIDELLKSKKMRFLGDFRKRIYQDRIPPLRGNTVELRINY